MARTAIDLSLANCSPRSASITYLCGRGRGSSRRSGSRPGFGRVGCGFGNVPGLAGDGPSGLTFGFWVRQNLTLSGASNGQRQHSEPEEASGIGRGSEQAVDDRLFV